MDISAKYNEAHVLSKKGDYWAAIEEYTKSLADNPEHFKSLFGRAFAYGQVNTLIDHGVLHGSISPCGVKDVVKIEKTSFICGYLLNRLESTPKH